MIALLLLLLLVAPTWAATYYTATSGGFNGNTCQAATNPTTPKQTITAGAGCLGSGDTLVVKSGVYEEVLNDVLPSGTGGNPTILRSEVQYGAILRPTTTLVAQQIITIRQKSYITMDGIVIDGANITNVNHIVTYGPSDHISVINSEIMNGHDAGFPNCWGISMEETDTNWYIARNRIHGIGADATVLPSADGRQSYGIYYTGSNGIIENNEIYNNGGFGIHHFSHGINSHDNIFRNNCLHDNGQVGIISAGGVNNLFYNNIFNHNATRDTTGFRTAAIFLGRYGYAPTDNGIYNNTVWNSLAPCFYIADGSTGTIIRNNICYQNTGDTIEQLNDTGTIIDHNLLGTNPLFVSEASGDFHVQAGSPAIDAGATLTAVLTDYAGVPRPQGSAYDIGVYESAGGAPPVSQMLAHLPLDAGSGTTADDATGHGYTGTLVSTPTWIPGRVGSFGLAFDGVQAHVSVAQVFTLTQYSWSVWLRGTTASNTASIAQPLSTSNDVVGFSWHHTNPAFQQAAFHQDGTGTYTAAKLTTPLLSTAWYHVTATYDGTTLRVYLNGALQVSMPASLTKAPAGVVTLGRNGANNNSPFAGTMDDVRIYNYVLSAADVLYLYRSTAGVPQHRMVRR